MIDISSYLDAARATTGLADFGDDSFRDGLERLVTSVAAEAALGDAGIAAMNARIIGLLAERLRIEDWYRRHPEIDNEQIVRPLVGVGLPRTGSTALAFMLAQDPNARSLLLWESNSPTPPPSTVVGPDPRIAEAEAGVEMQTKLFPRSQELVPSSATGPMECQMLMALDFKSQVFQAMGRVPTYSTWFAHDADLVPTYTYEKRVLKLLQWGTPTRPWRLKCPTHLLFLDAFDAVFPDARYVMTHRDPLEVLDSVVDLYRVMQSMSTTTVDTDYIIDVNVDHWSLAMQRVIAFRDNGNDHRFYDIDFRAMQADPIRQVRGLYDWLGEPITPRFQAGMETWWRARAESRPQNVHQSAGQLGLDDEAIRPRFAEYRERMRKWTAR